MTSTVSLSGAVSQRVPFELITANHEFNYRFNKKPAKDNAQGFKDLKASIASRGVIQNLLVGQIEGEEQYILVAGYRRHEAISQLLAEGVEIPGMEDGEIDVKVIMADSMDELVVLATAENYKRLDNSPMDTAFAVARLKAAGLQGKDIAKELGISPASVTQYSKLLTLDAKTQSKIANRELSFDTALTMLKEGLTNEEIEAAQEEVAKSGVTDTADVNKALRNKASEVAATKQVGGANKAASIEYRKPKEVISLLDEVINNPDYYNADGRKLAKQFRKFMTMGASDTTVQNVFAKLFPVRSQEDDE